jgi:hypothetical protein
MEIADLATSAGINLALAVLFFVLYSVFRKQPGNAGVYFTRHMLREKEKEVKKQPFSFEALVPSAGWVKKSWDPTEDDILHSSGLDAVVFLRIFIFGSVSFSTLKVLNPPQPNPHLWVSLFFYPKISETPPILKFQSTLL